MRIVFSICTLLALCVTEAHAVRDGIDYFVWGDNEAPVDSVEAHADSIIQQRASATPDTQPLASQIAANSTVICSVNIKALRMPTFRIWVGYVSVSSAVSPTHDSTAKITVRPWDGNYAESWHHDILDNEYQIRVDSTAKPYAGWWTGSRTLRRDAIIPDTLLIYIQNREGVVIDTPRVKIGSKRVTW